MQSSVPNSTVRYTSTIGDYAELLFNGTKSILTFVKGFSEGWIVELHILGLTWDEMRCQWNRVRVASLEKRKSDSQCGLSCAGSYFSSFHRGFL